MQDLKANEDVLKNVRLHSLWTLLDLSIIPAVSSYRDIAQNKKFYAPLHLLMLFNRKAADYIIKNITRK